MKTDRLGTPLSSIALPIVVSVAVALAGCSSAPAVKKQTPRNAAPEKPRDEEPGRYRSADALVRPLSQEEKDVIASAKLLVGQPPEAKVLVNGRTFVLDCIGTVAAVYYRLGIDVTKDFGKYNGNGVGRFYQSLKARNALHRDVIPRPGDAIIWDNTWDANGDGNLTNDPRTHAAVVVAVEEDGTIHYVHEHVRRGVIVEVMNLKRPRDYQDEKGKMINSPLALVSGTGRGRPEHWLAGDLLDAFGDVLREKTYFRVSSLEEGGGPLALIAPEAAP